MNTQKQRVTAREIVDLIRLRYSEERRYAVAEEVYQSTGGSGRRLDVVVLDCWQSGRFRVEGIEVKVSKADLRRELRDSDKHNAFFPWLDWYSIAAPQEVIDLEIIPKAWGIYAAMPNGSLKVIRKPLDLHDERRPDFARGFVASLMRAVVTKGPTAKALSDSYHDGYELGYNTAMSAVANTETARLMEERNRWRDAALALGADDGYLGQYKVERNKALLNCDTGRLLRDLEQLQKTTAATVRFLHDAEKAAERAHEDDAAQ